MNQKDETGVRGGQTTGPVGAHVNQRALHNYREFDGAVLMNARLLLSPCPCGEHGTVTVERADGQTFDVAAPHTQYEACQMLEFLIMRYHKFPEQPEFVEAVRAAHYLKGPMPVQL